MSFHDCVMHVFIRDHPPCLTIAMTKLTFGSSCEVLKGFLQTGLADGYAKFVIDLSRAEVDSSGIGTMVSSFCLLRKHCAEVEFVVNHKLHKRLDLCKVASVLPLLLAA